MFNVIGSRKLLRWGEKVDEKFPSKGFVRTYKNRTFTELFKFCSILFGKGTEIPEFLAVGDFFSKTL